MSQTISVEVVSDFVCPWCYVGKRRLQQALQLLLQQRPDVRAQVSFRPFQLNPDMPPEGKDRREHMISIFGAETADKILNNPSGIGREEGIEVRYHPGSRSPNTLAAHLLAQLALTAGKQEQLAEKLFAAFFTDGEDIGDSVVLQRIAAEVGLDASAVAQQLASAEAAAEVRAQAEHARAQGVTGVPFFIIDQRYALSGAQPAATLLDALKQALSDSAA